MKNTLNNHELRRDVGFSSATILVVANMVGTGVFTTSGFVMAEVGSPSAMLLCWFVGGLFALCGALCYGELGSLFPQAGGEYVFLRESFGKGLAFLSGWISLIVGFSAPIAAAAIAFATYFFRLFPSGDGSIPAMPFLGEGIVNISSVSLLAAGIIIVFSLVHYHSLSFGTRVQNVLTLFKGLLVVAFVGAGFLWGEGSVTNFSGAFTAGAVFQEGFAVSLIFVSFAYSGWNAAAYLGGEIKNPARNIPLALLCGTVLVMVFYMLLNGLYIYALPADEMKGVLEVGAESAVSLFGTEVSRIFTGAIALGLLSVLSAMIMAGPRVYYAMAKDGVFFKGLGKVNKLHRTPAHAIVLQAAIAVGMVVTASFDKLLIYIGFTLSLCATLTVLGMIKLRITHPDRKLKREYRTWGYPVTPILFILGNLWIVYFSIRSRPAASLAGLGTIVTGLLLFYGFRKTNPANKRQKESDATKGYPKKNEVVL